MNQIEQMEKMGKTWGLDCVCREDMMKRTLCKAFNTKREEVLSRLDSNQKRFALRATTDDLGISSSDIVSFMYDLYEECAYEDLATAEESIAFLQGAVGKKREDEREGQYVRITWS